MEHRNLSFSHVFVRWHNFASIFSMTCISVFPLNWYTFCSLCTLQLLNSQSALSSQLAQSANLCCLLSLMGKWSKILILIIQNASQPLPLNEAQPFSFLITMNHETQNLSFSSCTALILNSDIGLKEHRHLRPKILLATPMLSDVRYGSCCCLIILSNKWHACRQ